jgi:TRAP-type C4-dicarboxylate transport system permease small subunit
MLPSKVQRALDMLTSLLIGAFAATVINASLPVLNMNMFQRSPALGVQMSWIYIAIPISMGLIVLICAERVLKQFFSAHREEGKG